MNVLSSPLLEPSASQGWRLGLELERALMRRVPLIGTSLVLNHPRLRGTLGGYPYEEQALERVVRSPFRHAFRTPCRSPGDPQGAVPQSVDGREVVVDVREGLLGVPGVLRSPGRGG